MLGQTEVFIPRMIKSQSSPIENKTKSVGKQNLRFGEKSKRPLPHCPSVSRALTPPPTYLCHTQLHPRKTRMLKGSGPPGPPGRGGARRGAYSRPCFRYNFIASPRLQSARLDYKYSRAPLLGHLSLPGARRGRRVVIRVHLLLQQLHARRSLC
jgi:hypothetical protein